jgi:hypothetical protein
MKTKAAIIPNNQNSLENKAWRIMILFLSINLLFLFQCGSKPKKVERTIDNGVEVVINRLEPYSLPSEPSTLHLDEVLTIDSECREVAAAGLAMVDSFYVGWDGDIYLTARRSEHSIYRFDRNGKFLTSFGRSGQGPGEFEGGANILNDEGDRLFAKDIQKDKFFVFNNEGALLEEVRLENDVWPIQYLGNQKFLVWRQVQDPIEPVFRNFYGIANATLGEVKEFFRSEFEDPIRAPRYKAVRSGLVVGASAKNIFFGNAEKGYEILVFDLEGKLVRKIRKAFRPVPVPEEYKTLVRKLLEGRGSRGLDLIKKMDWPPHLPPFRYLLVDEQERLYVMTSEREGERKYWYDIFTSGGVFINRIMLDNVQVNYFEGQRYDDLPLHVVVKSNRLYCLREKDTGFKALTVYKMTWE